MKHATSWDDAFLKYAPEPSDGCWYWMGNIRNGYGRIAFRQSLLYAHRYAYERLHGPIPDGMTVDHMCHNEDPNCPGGKPCMHRRCVNPAHLAIATSVINAGRAARIARTGRCTKGHKVSGDNVYVIRGLPNCRECHLARQHAYELRRDHKADIRAGGDGVVWAGVSR